MDLGEEQESPGLLLCFDQYMHCIDQEWGVLYMHAGILCATYDYN